MNYMFMVDEFKGKIMERHFFKYMQYKLYGMFSSKASGEKKIMEREDEPKVKVKDGKLFV